MKDAYFSVSLHQSSRKPLRVPVPMLWVGPSPKNFHQIVESSNINAEKNKHSNNDLPRRYAFNGSSCGRNFSVQGHSNLPFATLGFILNLEMSIFSSAQEVEFISLKVNSLEVTVLLTQEKY